MWWTELGHLFRLHQCFQAPATWEVQGVFALIQSPAFASAERFLQLPSKILSHLPQLWNLSFPATFIQLHPSTQLPTFKAAKEESLGVISTTFLTEFPRCGCEHRKNGGRNLHSKITSWYDMVNYPIIQGFKHPMWCRISSINSTCGLVAVSMSLLLGCSSAEAKTL